MRMRLAIPKMPEQKGMVQYLQESSVTDATNSGIGHTGVSSLDANQWPNSFTDGNIQGVFIRVAAAGGSSPSGFAWTTSNTKIAHNLGYIPVGWIIVYKDKVCDVWAGSPAPDNQFVYLNINDSTVNTTLWIF